MNNEYQEELEKLRHSIDAIDDVLYRTLEFRVATTTKIGELKKKHGISEMSMDRRDEIYKKLKDWAMEDGIPVTLVTRIYDIIFEYSVLEQVLIINENRDMD